MSMNPTRTRLQSQQWCNANNTYIRSKKKKKSDQINIYAHIQKYDFIFKYLLGL